MLRFPAISSFPLDKVHRGLLQSLYPMNISVKSEYALHAIFDLSVQPQGEPVKIAEISRRQKIPQKFLELILSGLKQGGFVESRRGAVTEQVRIGCTKPSDRPRSARRVHRVR